MEQEFEIRGKILSTDATNNILNLKKKSKLHSIKELFTQVWQFFSPDFSVPFSCVILTSKKILNKTKTKLMKSLS
jgi:hypothetical protein